MSKLCKQLLQNDNNDNLFKWAKDPCRHCSKEDIQISSRHMKRCLASLIIREIQIKNTMRHHITLIRMAVRQEITNDDKDVEERKPLCTVGRNVNWCSLYGKEYGDSF